MTETHPQNRRLGYARVSTYGQTLDAQLEQLRGAGCKKIYREKVTGAHSDRRELLKILGALAPGDVVTVTRIDRLARSLTPQCRLSDPRETIGLFVGPCPTPAVR